MRNLVLFLLLIFIAGCDAATTCKECGEAASVNQESFCRPCMKHLADVAEKAKAAKRYVGWGRDYEAAKVRAKAENKSMFVVFTGSDWCSFCQGLHDNVFASDEFRNLIPDDVVLVVCDDPRDEELTTEAERQQYEVLCQRFKVSGVPTLLLIDSNGIPYHRFVGYEGTPANEWVKDLVVKIRNQTDASER